MPILSVEGMMDAVEGNGHLSATVGSALAGTPYLILANSAATFSQVTVSKDADGWLTTRTGPATSSTTAQAKYCGISRHLADVVSFTASSFVYGGVRIKANVNATQLPLVTLHDRRPANMPNANANQLVIFNYLDISGGVVKDQEYYFEWAIDMPNKKVLRRLDGVRLADIALSALAGLEAALLLNAMGICYGFSAGYMVAGSTVVGYSVRDIYMGEKVAGETVDWLGPQRVVPLVLESVSAPGWTTSDSTDVKTVLSKAISVAADISSPLVSTDASVTEAQLKFSADVKGSVVAVQFNAVAQRQVGNLANLRAKVSLDGTDSTSSFIDLVGGPGLRKAMLLTKAPGGAPWTKESIAASTFKLVAAMS
jgi:hypothetical protein